MDAEQREQIKERFMSLVSDARRLDDTSSSDITDLLLGIVEETEAERIRREERAAEKSRIIAMEQMAPELIAKAEVNAPRPGNPMGFNQRIRDPKMITLRPFETHDEHDEFMMKLVQLIRGLEEMGTNSLTNNKHWVLEGNEVGNYARKMRNALFPVQTAIPKQKPEDVPANQRCARCGVPYVSQKWRVQCASGACGSPMTMAEENYFDIKRYEQERAEL